jgi:hypothetical protein
MRFARLAATAAAVALCAATAAHADGTPVPVQPLTAAGYTVQVASDLGGGCTNWYVTGHGVASYLDDCDPNAAATIASWTNAETIYEADWQLNHPDQLQAAETIAANCYSISRTAPETDQWHIVGGATDTTTDGAGLPALAGSLPSVCGGPGPAPVAAVVPTTDGTGTVTQPGDTSVTSAIDANAAAIQTAQLSAAATPTAVADASQQAQTDAVSSGADPAVAALAARSAGLDVMYGIDPAATTTAG